MPLSEYEQRVLEQMERSLASDDPKLANTLTSRTRQTGRLLLGLLAIMAGLGLLVGAVAAAQAWLGIAGFLVMLLGGYLALSKPRSAKAAKDAAAAAGPAPRPRSKRGKSNKGSFLQRIEERWDRRRRNNDF